MSTRSASGRGSPQSTSVKPRVRHHTGEDADDFEAPVPSATPDSPQDVAAAPAEGAPGFLEGFENEPDLAPAPAAPEAPPWPTSTSLTQDSYYNFISLSNGSNVANGYGATALMCVVGFNSACYGTVRPGTVFLFPGTYNGHAPAYVGTPHIDCAPHAPLNGSSGVPLHAQMCALLGQPTTNFIGFAANYPLNRATMGYNSATCNVHWFGTRTLPLDWQVFVYDALEQAISVADAGRDDLADEPSPTPDRPAAPVAVSTPASGHLTERNTSTMSSVQIAPVSKPVPAADDVRLAASALNATVTSIDTAGAGITVHYVGALDPRQFRAQLSRIAGGDQDSWQFAWDAAANGGAAAVAGTQYGITINMSDDTVIKLLDGGFKLFAFKAVQTPQGGGLPTVWFTNDTYSGTTEITWEEQYQAYTSRSKIIPGGKIDSSKAYPIDFGQTLEVGPGGTGTVTGQVQPALPIYIENTVTTQYTCGISQLHDDKYTPLCALPLYGLNTDTIRPIERVLLMFATDQINTGTVIEESFTSGALIDLTTDVSRDVTYEINNGWGPAKASWLTLVPSRTALDDLLIVPPSAALSAQWASLAASSSDRPSAAGRAGRTSVPVGS